MICITRHLRRALVTLVLAPVAVACDRESATGPLPRLPRDASELSLPTSRAAAFDSAMAQFGSYSGFQTRARVVIRDAETWKSAWVTMAAGREPQPVAPEVDFSTEMVVLAAMGSRSSGGYAIDIPIVYEREGDVFAVVSETSPGSRCFTTQALTAPVAALLLAARSNKILFEEIAAIHEC